MAGDDDEVTGPDDLYGLAPNTFTAARNALAKQLKADGRADEATEVAALRKPPVTAWALNRAARDHPELVEEALAAGARLRDATEAALGGDASGLRDASADQRQAASALVEAAAALLGSGGASSGAATRMAATVHAAALDDEVAEALRRGVLAADHDRSGLGLGAGFGAAVAASPTTPAATPGRPALRVLQGGRSTAGKAEEQAKAKAEARAAEEAAERRKVARRAARRRVDELRGRADVAEREAARTAGDAERLEAEANRARMLALDAEDAAEAARSAVAQAEAELAELGTVDR